MFLDEIANKLETNQIDFFPLFRVQSCDSVFSLHFTTFQLLPTLHKEFVAIKKQNNVIEIKKNVKRKKWFFCL